MWKEIEIFQNKKIWIRMMEMNCFGFMHWFEMIQFNIENSYIETLRKWIVVDGWGARIRWIIRNQLMLLINWFCFSSKSQHFENISHSPKWNLILHRCSSWFHVLCHMFTHDLSINCNIKFNSYGYHFGFDGNREFFFFSFD